MIFAHDSSRYGVGRGLLVSADGKAALAVAGWNGLRDWAGLRWPGMWGRKSRTAGTPRQTAGPDVEQGKEKR